MIKELKNLTPKDINFSQWYNDIIINADLAENSDIRGCMIVKPYGYAIWEKIQKKLDSILKKAGYLNVYFPLFIPKSFLSKEADHIKGFSKECAIVTHYRLKNSTKGIVIDPDAKLKEELIVRPTSETIIWNTYKKWIQSYRDLPILMNQWANVIRWEMRPRLFLRTTEFLWQEGHTAHATKKEALQETLKVLNIYTNFVEKYMAIPVIKGIKTQNERFAGALDTYCIEALMQDGKALQMGTSHFLGQNFAKAFNVQFFNQKGIKEYVWATSWGISSRLIGALVMTHSDNNGLILPPKLAPQQVVIVPIIEKNKKNLIFLNEKITNIIDDLKKSGISVKYDNSENKKPGWKFAKYELKGVPIRLTFGMNDLRNGTIEVARRDTLTKKTISINCVTNYVKILLKNIQKDIFQKALNYHLTNTIYVNTYDEFKNNIKNGGFIMAHWDGTSKTEKQIKEETKATIRCIPLYEDLICGKDLITGMTSKRRVVFAKTY
ncbi:MAG: proline--tRNA ligase [Bacteroidales bacterium OttesenSCG-928-I14]|jgi:prolyl-tRNA synthetase|nr:proline--tRNA ligase [Bacteroidales bacterium OttesenSCG-928-I14]